jgi:mRNA deadenylase 3'-5' endonuclease subunit Ccr4
MKIATYNVLADAYTGYGDYSHVDPKLLVPGARRSLIVEQINDLRADIVGIQEADKDIVLEFEKDESWQTFWTPKRHKPDGCLTLVNNKIKVTDFKSYKYNDESGHVFQILQIGQIAVINTHIKWAPTDSKNHIGVNQARQLLKVIGMEQPAVILADCNDQPNGPVRQLILDAGFINVFNDLPTALVNRKLVALDLLAVRSLRAERVGQNIDVNTIPNELCPSDHIPLVANIQPSNPNN